MYCCWWFHSCKWITNSRSKQKVQSSHKQQQSIQGAKTPWVCAQMGRFSVGTNCHSSTEASWGSAPVSFQFSHQGPGSICLHNQKISGELPKASVHVEVPRFCIATWPLSPCRSFTVRGFHACKYLWKGMGCHRKGENHLSNCRLYLE